VRFPKLSLYQKIILKKIIPFCLVVIAIASLWFFLKPQKTPVVAGITVTSSGQTISFGSGFYSVDKFGYVYQKESSSISGTPNTIKSYSHVSYLSAPYLYESSHLNITNKNVIIGSEAIVLMEGSLELNSLTLNGGLISQPQTDRNGKINSIQYSDQEWGIEFYTFLKVNAGEKRKITCPTDYYQSADEQMGNGCITSYSATYDGSESILLLDNWLDMDKVWQEDATTFALNRYTELSANYIDNDSAEDRYYPIRIRFKNDNRDERNEIMSLILRDEANEIIAGSETAMPLTNIYGFDDDGVVDVAAQGKAYFNYYLLNSYVANESNPQQGYIEDDFSNAYATYTNNEITINTFFADNFGLKTSGLFDLIFDDNTNIDAYSSTYASSPFAKGTSTVYSEEVYYSYRRSAKELNSVFLDSLAVTSPRYQNAGLELSIKGDVEFNGGAIDISGRGYAGYDFELRKGGDQNAETLFGSIRGGSYGEIESGGLSSNYLPQAPAHSSKGGGGRLSSGQAIPYNQNYYGDVTTSNTLGSGGGASYRSGDYSSIGGDGGGYLKINANEVLFNSKDSYIKANGTVGKRIYSSSQAYYSGGAGGSVYLIANALKVNYDTLQASKCFDVSGSSGEDEAVLSSGGSGGYLHLTLNDLIVDGAEGEFAKDQLIAYYSVSGGHSTIAADYSGENGESLIEIDVQPIDLDLSDKKLDKKVEIAGERPSGSNLSDYEIYSEEEVKITVTVPGKVDLSSGSRRPLDVVLLSDISSSMIQKYNNGDDTKIEKLRKALREFLDTVVELNSKHNDYIRISLVDFPTDYGPTLSDDDWQNKASKFISSSGEVLVSDESVINSQVKSYIDTSYSDAIVEGHQTGTPAGSGIKLARQVLTEGEGARPESYKYIIMLTDGRENQPVCMTKLNDENCVDADDKYHYNVPPETGSPIDLIKNDKIALFNIFIPGDAEGDLEFGKALKAIAEHCRPSYLSSEEVYYDSSGYDSLTEVYKQILTQIMRGEVGVPFKFQETLPEGTEIIETSISRSNNDTISSNVCSPDPTNSNKRICSIGLSDYPLDLSGSIDFKFTFTVKFEKVRGWVDVDQNRVCNDDSPGQPLPTTGSFVSYSAFSPVAIGSSTSAPTKSVCKKILPNKIAGDVYGANSLDYFAMFGKNLSLNTNSSGAVWDLKEYTANENSQMSDVEGTINKIKKYKGEAQTISNFAAKTAWYLQGENLSDSGQKQKNIYPEGKFWFVNENVNLDKNTYKYYGQGTIIIEGNLTINKDTNIAGDENSSLGLVVLGDVNILGGNDLKIYLLSTAKTNFNGDDIKINGSMLSREYLNLKDHYGLEISYNYQTGEMWPPGFRYFNMPVPISINP